MSSASEKWKTETEKQFISSVGTDSVVLSWWGGAWLISIRWGTPAGCTECRGRTRRGDRSADSCSDGETAAGGGNVSTRVCRPPRSGTQPHPPQNQGRHRPAPEGGRREDGAAAYRFPGTGCRPSATCDQEEEAEPGCCGRTGFLFCPVNKP